MSGEPTVAIGGAEGAFADLAARAFFHGVAFVHAQDFDDAVARVKTGSAHACLLPLENSSAGPVPATHRLLLELRAPKVWAETTMPIRHQLLGAPGATLESIRRVVSHPMALAQCQRLLSHHGWTAVPGPDTAGAAKDLKASGPVDTAVLASEAAAEAYGLSVLKRDVQDAEDNATRFVVLGSAFDAGPGATPSGHRLLLALPEVEGRGDARVRALLDFLGGLPDVAVTRELEIESGGFRDVFVDVGAATPEVLELLEPAVLELHPALKVLGRSARYDFAALSSRLK